MRALVESDAAAVAALIRQAFSSACVMPPPTALNVTADVVERHLAEGGGGAVAGPVWGCLLWAERDEGLYLGRLAVAAEHRRTGLAWQLLIAAEREAKRRALPRMWLTTRLAMQQNRRLFARFGFVEGARHAHPGFDQPTMVDMEKRL